ncbi:hypothetical protein [Azospirillum sp. B510]|uniref:hypothetical protein n=1 Tax=Azospirillum sp. (strain B510) TaxID=137722 RepID=UPI0011D10B42|nr:hypothetical protein [Azospirillum sp. B510]
MRWLMVDRITFPSIDEARRTRLADRAAPCRHGRGTVERPAKSVSCCFKRSIRRPAASLALTIISTTSTTQAAR